MSEPILSLLICSVNSRKEFLDRLLEVLNKQLQGQEILVNLDNGEKSIGRKRNELLQQATGKYIAFIDDDDLVSEDYISLILDAVKDSCDVVGMHLIHTYDGQPFGKTYHSLKYDHWYDEPNPSEPGTKFYYRNPNHLNPVKREYALKVKFPEISNGEDRAYSKALLPFLKSEVYIDKPIYYYLYRSRK